MDEKYTDILNVLRNQTKMKIVTLLINYKKMTVTGMAKYIKTTRSNLYQIMTELVSSGIVNEPEIKPKKNYVEKYYSLNKDYFAFSSSFSFINALSGSFPSNPFLPPSRN